MTLEEYLNARWKSLDSRTRTILNLPEDQEGMRWLQMTWTIQFYENLIVQRGGTL